MAFVPKGIPLWELCGGTVAALLVGSIPRTEADPQA